MFQVDVLDVSLEHVVARDADPMNSIRLTFRLGPSRTCSSPECGSFCSLIASLYHLATPRWASLLLSAFAKVSWESVCYNFLPSGATCANRRSEFMAETKARKWMCGSSRPQWRSRR